MKHIILPILLLTTLTSCGKSAKDSVNHHDRETVQTGTNGPREYIASVESAITISQTEIVFLNSKLDIDKDSRGSCFVETINGHAYPFKLYADDLIITENGQAIKLTRVLGNSYSIQGTWVRDEIDGNMDTTLTIEIDSYEHIRVTNVCRRNS